MICPVRSRKIRSDSEGDGHYGAPRGNRKHIGIDLISYVGENVLSPVSGVINRLGFAYSKPRDSNYIFKIISIEDKDGLKHELFYVNPCVKVGDTVEQGNLIGQTQDLRIQYPLLSNMKNHVHLQIKNNCGIIINPTRFYKDILIT